MDNKWKEFAEINGMTVEEFQNEIFIVACAIGTMKIDGEPSSDGMRFKTSDEISDIELTIMRKPKPVIPAWAREQ